MDDACRTCDKLMVKESFHRIPLVRCSRTLHLLTNYEPVAVYLNESRGQGTRTMADRSGLKLVGFIFATVTLAVMLVTGMVVKGYADGAFSLETTAIAAP